MNNIVTKILNQLLELPPVNVVFTYGEGAGVHEHLTGQYILWW